MKLIIAIIQPEELPEIKEELIKIENFALGGLLHLGRYAPFREIHNEY